MSGNILNAIQLRVLGSLLEKEATTPEYYPLTLNALVAACNQKTNRWPVTNYSESEIAEALRALRAARFAAELSGVGMRVPKHSQRMTETLNLGRRETAILCVLMLRGAQTLGEIKDRTERMHSFADLDEVEMVLGKLAERGLAVQIQRQPGQKESRYVQLLGEAGESEATTADTRRTAGSLEGQENFRSDDRDRLNALEEEVTRLRTELDELRRKLEAVL